MDWEQKLNEISKIYVTELTVGPDFLAICTTWNKGLVAYTKDRRVPVVVEKMYDVIFNNAKDDSDVKCFGKLVK